MPDTSDQSKATSPTMNFFDALRPMSIARSIYYLIYGVVQAIIIAVFKPPIPPATGITKPRGRIAVVGAGLTGVSTAAHCIAHGFDVVIYDENDSVGGIWSHVNSTSGLQLNSMLYRFFPSVHWSKAFPLRDEILSQIREIWQTYHLVERTRLNTPVKYVTRHPQFSTDPKKFGHGRWVINNGEDGIFDAIFCAVGTCGEPIMVGIEGKEEFGGRIVHSSELDTLKSEEIKGKKIVIVGSGASGVEAAELAVAKGAGDIEVIARDDKWIIPRNIVFDTLLSMQPFGRETPLSFITEYLLKKFHYRDLECIAPAKRVAFYSATPIVNDAFLEHIREGKVTYIRGDTLKYNSEGVSVSVRGKVWSEKGRQIHSETYVDYDAPKSYKDTSASSSNDTLTNDAHEKAYSTTTNYKKVIAEDIESILPGHYIDAGQGGRFTTSSQSKSSDLGSKSPEPSTLKADIVVVATGFKQPPVSFLPEDLFPEGFQRPNLYLQNFSTEDWSVCLTNAAYKNAIGTVGHFHIGIYARILMMFLMDKDCRPLPDDLKLWVNIIKYIKRDAPGGALSFFTYMELMIWVITFMFFRPQRLRWAPFVLFGWGVPADGS